MQNKKNNIFEILQEKLGSIIDFIIVLIIFIVIIIALLNWWGWNRWWINF